MTHLYNTRSVKLNTAQEYINYIGSNLNRVVLLTGKEKFEKCINLIRVATEYVLKYQNLKSTDRFKYTLIGKIIEFVNEYLFTESQISTLKHCFKQLTGLTYYHCHYNLKLKSDELKSYIDKLQNEQQHKQQTKTRNKYNKILLKNKIMYNNLNYNILQYII